jgi:hypothetical protein
MRRLVYFYSATSRSFPAVMWNIGGRVVEKERTVETFAPGVSMCTVLKLPVGAVLPRYSFELGI